MLYAIFGTDAANSGPARASSRADHLARVALLRDQGTLVLAGPHPAIDSSEPGDAGFTGSLIVAEFASLDAARRWAEADPYLAAGAWSTVSVRPFIRVMP
jgi:hypothetical protein